MFSIVKEFLIIEVVVLPSKEIGAIMTGEILGRDSVT